VSTPSIRELRQARAREGQRSPKWLRLLFVILGLFALYVVTGFFIAPGIVRSQLEKRLSTELGREVRVSKVALNPLTLSGAIEGFAIHERDGGKNFIAWKRAFANFDSWSLFGGEWHFDEVMLDGAEAHVAVARDGTLNFADVIARLTARMASAADKGKSDTATKPLRISRLTVGSAQVTYREETEPQPFSTVVGPISFAVREFSTGGKNQAPGEFSATTESGESIGWRGQLAVLPLRSNGEVSLGGIVLKKYMPYISRFAPVSVSDGTFSFKSRYELVIAQGKPALRLHDGEMHLKSLKLGAPEAKEPAVALDAVDVSGLAMDSDARSASVGRVAISGGHVSVTRDAQGIDLLRLLQPNDVDTPASSGLAAGPAVSSSMSPTASLGELAIEGVSVSILDETTPRPARQEIEQLSLNVKDVSLARLAQASPILLSARLGGGGSLRVSGNLAPQPLKGDLTLELENAPLASVSPYLENFVAMRLAKGVASTKMQVSLAPASPGALPVITVRADATVGDFEALEGDGTDELARWKMLSIRGIEAVTSPSIKLLIADVEWTEPVGHVIVGKDGTVNLLGLMKAPGANAGAGTAASVSFNGAGGKASTAAVAATPPFVAIDRFVLNNARFTFLDRSVEPGVKLSLDQLSGGITGLSSATLARADVDLKGKVDGVAPVSIRGQINPLAAEAFTDLKVDFRGIDLQPAAPYVGKFAGYRLDGGSLTLDVKAKLAQRRLDTSNVVTLDQFTLGEKVDSPQATKLPVGLALALLRDRQGKIVLDVPVEGSLDDPEFRVGRVVMRVLGNIFTKAATSPFSVLGSMFGGGSKGEELAYQEFTPGTDEFTGDSVKKLAVLAQALTERPGLRLEVAGAYDVAKDAPALREQTLDKGIRVALWDEQRKSAQPGAVVPPPEQITVTPEASARMITAFYRAAFEPKEPVSGKGDSGKADTEKNAGESGDRKGFWAPVVRMFRRNGAPPSAQSSRVVKAPPPRPISTATAGGDGQAAPAAPAGPTVEEMRAKLLAAVTVDQAELRGLAAQRAQKVRTYLVENGGIEPERISLVAETAKGARVDLQLK
jgi:hypothetical protein